MVIEAPACHGMASAVSAQSPTCQACPHARSCVRDAALFLVGLPDSEVVRRERQLIVVTGKALLHLPLTRVKGEGAPLVVASTRGVQRVSLTPKEEALVQGLPKRVASQVRSLMTTGWFEFARTELLAGRNPADKGWKDTYCRQLLGGQATRETLRLAFMQELNLTAASAKVQLSNALSIFAAGNLAVETGGKLQLVANPVDRP
ncbi:hypothetical protein D9M72_161720 [compost metagenome]